MKTLYKSSKYATYSQYLLVPIFVGFSFYFTYLYYSVDFLPEEKYLIFFIPIFLWASILSLINLKLVKYIEVCEENIKIKSIFGGDKILDYKNIEWINQNIFGSNWYIISINYKENENGKSKLMLILPEQYTRREGLSILNPFGELNITKFIREQVIKINPSYKIENEPSRWYLVKWILISIIPFLFLSFLMI